MSRWEEIIKDGYSEQDFEINPDDPSVNLKEIWESDPDNKEGSICGDLTKNTPEGINLMNETLARQTGLFCGIDYIKKDERVLDIGCGFGMVGKAISSGAVMCQGLFQFKQVDIVKRFEECELVDGTGNLDIEDSSVHRVFCSNMFQHLSKKQRKKYFEEIHRVLPVGGMFNFGTNMSDFIPKDSKSWYKDDFYTFNVKYCTPMMNLDEGNRLIKDKFNTISSSKRFDGYMSFCLRKV